MLNHKKLLAMGQTKTTRSITAAGLFFLLFDDREFFIMHTHAERHYSFCRIRSIRQCLYGRSDFAELNHTY